MQIDERQHAERRHEAATRLGDALRALRHSRNLSQEQVALDAGLSVDTYGYLERGQTPWGRDANPRIDTLLRIFTVLGVDAPRLLREAETDGEK
ncbi:helix-turn-helix domain-containing protein [Microbacterium sp. NPDC058062]|uniref:helix-turn-helix domain-containing protein n=1 Tax=Microbacterium sp. NPDC058062 TaxID=3346320 RepID=UPI0036D95985